jgi:ABC-type transport system involved in multi-copper enzyme maturation permease subunit
LGNARIWPGPVLAVELVTMSRRTRYFVLRVIYAAALFFALWTTYEETARWRRFADDSGDMNSIAAFTAAFFATFGAMQLLAVLLIGPALAAGTIAQERERRTIEYLYATPLSNLEIVIGKLGGRVLQILGIVLAGVPVLALAMLLGGITPGALVSLTAITLSTVLFVTMVSLAVSAWTAKARDAVIRAYLVFFCLWVLPLFASALAELNSSFAWAAPILKQVVVANPLMTFAMILSGRGPWGVVAEPWSLSLPLVRNQMLAGGTALVLATFFMRRIHLRESGKPSRKRRWRFQFFRGMLGDNPMYWKELYAEPGSSRLGLLGYGLLTLIFIAVCGITVYMLSESVNRPYMRNGESYCMYATTMSTFLSCCGLLLMTARAASSITSEKERDCWASLIGTPLEGGQIIKAKILGSLWSLRGLVPFLAVVWLPALLLRPSFFLSIGFTLLDLGILAAFLATLGVYYSLRCKSTLRAMGAALGTAILFGGGYLMCCCPVAEIGARGSNTGMQLGLIPCMPFLLAWPGAASLLLNETRSADPEFGGFMAAYLIGTLGYAVAALMMLVNTIEGFDANSGRTRGRSDLPRPSALRAAVEDTHVETP